jgi:hypothetical protein
VSAPNGASPTRYIPSIVLALITIAYLIAAARYRPDARALPLLAGSLALGLLVLDLISLTQGRLGSWLTQSMSPERDAPIPVFGRARQAKALAWVCTLTGLSLLIGVLPALLLYVTGSVRFFGRRSWLISALTGILVTGSIWLVFAHVLNIPFYAGWLAERAASHAPAP